MAVQGHLFLGQWKANEDFAGGPALLNARWHNGRNFEFFSEKAITHFPVKAHL